MASIKEAYDSTIGENFTGLKIILWAIPLTMFRNMLHGGSLSFFEFCFCAAFLLILLGLLAESANNALEKKPVLVPGLNLIMLAINGLKTIFGVGIYVAIAYILGNLLCGFVNIESPVLTMSSHIIIWLLVISLPLTGFMLFIRKLDLFAAFNLKKLTFLIGDSFIMFPYLIIKLGLISALIIGFISYMFWLFVGLENSLINYIWSIAILYNLIIATNYIAQFTEETIVTYEKNENIITGAKLY